MTLLDACASFCAAMETTFGPTLTELIFIGALMALGWWRARKAIGKAEAKATAAVAETQGLKLSIARIEGSLRPAAPSSSVPPAEVLGTPSSASSGTFQPVVMPPRPSMANPDLINPTIPRPSEVPSFDRDTPHERPSGKS